jgi:hypothetical protein
VTLYISDLLKKQPVEQRLCCFSLVVEAGMEEAMIAKASVLEGLLAEQKI